MAGPLKHDRDFSELLNALKLERRLLLLSQENYRSLKAKFVQLSAEHEHFKETVGVDW